MHETAPRGQVQPSTTTTESICTPTHSSQGIQWQSPGLNGMSSHVPPLEDKLAEGVDIENYRLSETAISLPTASIDEKKRVIVVGAGMVGLATCLYLAKYGHEVVCVEKETAVAMQSSLCNDGILDPSVYGSWSDVGNAVRAKSSRFNPVTTLRQSIMSRPTITNLFQGRPSVIEHDSILLETPKEVLIENVEHSMNTIEEDLSVDDLATDQKRNSNPLASNFLKSQVNPAKALKMKWKRFHPPIKFELKTLGDPSFWKWGLNYLLHNGKQRMTQNARCIRQLGFYSLEKLKELEQTYGDDCLDMQRTALGTIELFPDPDKLDAIHTSDRKRHLNELGADIQTLNHLEIAEHEPALTPDDSQYCALLSSGTSGDMHKTCVGLYKLCLRLGVMFRFDTEVQELLCDRKRAFAVQTRSGALIEGDDFVLALGKATTTLAKRAAIPLNMYPVKGYVLSVPVRPEFEPPKYNIFVRGVTLISPVGTTLRISGGTEFAGPQPSPESEQDLPENTDKRSSFFSKTSCAANQQKRVETLFKEAEALFPAGYMDTSKLEMHVTCRHVTADGLPNIGCTRVPNVYVNGGFGCKGYTLSFGAGALLAHLISGREPDLAMEKFAPYRFGTFRT